MPPKRVRINDEVEHSDGKRARLEDGSSAPRKGKGAAGDGGGSSSSYRSVPGAAQTHRVGAGGGPGEERDKDLSDSDEEVDGRVERTIDSDDEETDPDKEKEEAERRRAKKQLKAHVIEALEEEGAVDDFDNEMDARIMPFNLKEEMETGHFDQSGHYHEAKGEGGIHDAWLDSMEWGTKAAAAERSKMQRVHEQRQERLQAEDESEELDRVAHMRQLMELLRAGESVFAALRRLGKDSKPAPRKGTAASRKKAAAGAGAGGEGAEATAEEKRKEMRVTLLRITELADQLLHAGEASVYEYTPERMAHEIKTAEERQAKASAAANEVQWVYKWAAEDPELHGPFSSSQMEEWKEQGFFPNSVLVRRADRDGEFASSARVEFDLFT